MAVALAIALAVPMPLALANALTFMTPSLMTNAVAVEPETNWRTPVADASAKTAVPVVATDDARSLKRRCCRDL